MMKNLLNPGATAATPILSGAKKLLFGLILLCAFSVQGQVSSYNHSTTVPTSYTPLTAPDVLIAPGYDNARVGLTFGSGFTFNFNGRNFTSCNVSSNGYITLDGVNTVTNVAPIASTEVYKNAISIYGMHLTGSGSFPLGGQLAGTIPNRTYTIEWIASRDGLTAISMQMVLHESAAGSLRFGEIDFIYRGQSFLLGARYGQVGLRGENNNDFYTLTKSSTVSWAAANLLRGVDNAGTVRTGNSFSASGSNISNPGIQITWSPPACKAPTLLNIPPGSIAATIASVAWTAPQPTAPTGGYDYYVTAAAPNNMNVSAGTPNASTIPTGSVGAGVTTANLTGLTGSTLYYVYVRSDCGGSKSGWSAPVTFTTKCPPQSVAFYDPFDSPNFADCASIQTIAGNAWTNIFGGPLADGFVGSYARIKAQNLGGVTNNSTYFINGVTLVAGTRYRLEYKYGSSTVFPTGRQNLKLRYGLAPQVASMTTTLMDHVDFRGGPYTQVINFVVPTSGVYYFGFTDTSTAGNETTYIDNFRVQLSTCIEPNALLLGGATNTTASISWMPGTPNNASGGYNYYVSTSATPPTDATVPTGSTAAGVTFVTVSGLTPGATYFFWVRSNCGAGDVSVWSNPLTFTTTNVPLSSYCVPVSASNASYIVNVQSTGAIANINNTSTLPASAPFGYQNFTSKEIVQARGGSVTINTSIAGPTVGSAIWVDWNKNGTFEATERVYNTTTYYTILPAATFIVPLTAAIGTTTMRVMIDYWGTNPNNPCTYNPTGTRGESEDYSFTVKPKPTDIILSATSASICSGGTTDPVFITNPAAYNVYSWTPTGVMGDNTVGYTFAPNSTITYTLTGLNTTTSATTSTTFTVNVNQPPSNITITPAAATRCESDTALTMIMAGGGVTTGAIIYSENFNQFTNTFTVESSTTGPPGGGTTSGGAVAQGLFHLEPDGLNTNGEVFHSPDASQFMISNSDDQGIGTQTHTSLTSASIDLSGSTTAQLSFLHYYRKYFTDQNVTVEVSTDNFATRTVLRTYNNPQGSSDNWINVNVDLTPYVGNSNVKIRFRFDTVWGWTWAIDNVVVTGSSSSSVSWLAQVSPGPKAPPTDLFLDAAGTIPYVAGDFAGTVYSAATVTTTYFATATTNSGTGCSTEQGMTVTVTPNNAGLILPGTYPNLCSGVLPPFGFQLTGTSPGGNYIWESSPTPPPAFVPTVVAGTANLPILTPVLAGQLIADTYYRVRFTPSTGTCGVTYSDVVAVTVPHTTWNGTSWSNGNPDNTKMAVISGNYTAPGNITACSVVQTAGVSNFPSGSTLLVTNQVVKQGLPAVKMVFENSANLVQINSVIPNNGKIDYKRITSPIRVLDYTYWSSPMSDLNIRTVSPLTLADKYYYFEPIPNTWKLIDPSLPSFNMTPAKGYIIRGPQDYTTYGTAFPYAARLVGTPNNGDITFPIETGIGTMNLIGNPYPSSISANAFIAANAGKMTGALYFWTHNTSPSPYLYVTTDYATYNLTGTLAGAAATGPGPNMGIVPNGFIGAAQGFSIKGTQPGTVQGIFTNAMRGTGYSNTQFFRNGDTYSEPAEVEKRRIWLDVSNATGNFRQTLIGYVDGATNGIDYGFDAEYLGGGNPVEFYSKVADKKVSIKAVGLPFNYSDEHALVFKTTVAGAYQIAASQFDSSFDGVDIFVEDRLMNTVHNLKDGPYSFTTETGTFEDRFVIKFAQGLLATSTKTFDQNNVVVYKKDQKIYVNSGKVVMKSVELLDVRGARIMEQKAINSNETVLSPNAAQQVLIVKIKSVDGAEVSKKIVF